MATYTKYNHLAESGLGADIVAALVSSVHYVPEFGRYQRQCSRYLDEVGDDHPWNEWLDNLQGGDLQYEAICRAAHYQSSQL